jgi:hypothetical protein
MNFEWTLRAGDILTLVGGLSVAAAFLYRRGGQETGIQITLKTLTEELAEMKTEFKAFGETLTQVATQEVKINLLMKWYDELRRGVGFVQGPRGIDREYGRE